MKGQGLLYTLIGLMVVFWSGNFIVGKIALREFPPMLLSGLRVALAALVIWPAYWWQGRKANGEERWGRADLPLLIYLGLFGVALNQILFVCGLSRTTVAHSAIIIGMTPILVLLAAAAFKLEQITVRKVIGMLVALCGVAVLNLFETQRNAGGPTWSGDCMIFLAAFAFALFTALGKRSVKQHSSVTVNTFAYVGGALALSPITVWEASRFSLAHVSAAAWACLLYMALFPSVICYLIYYYALTRIAASRVSAFTYLQPPLAALMGVLILREQISLSLVAGGTVIFSGVYLTERG